MPASFVGMDPAPQAVQIERPAMGAKRAVGQSSQGESGSGLLVPETLATATVVDGPATGNGEVECLLIHVSKHQNLTRFGVLRDGR